MAFIIENSSLEPLLESLLESLFEFTEIRPESNRGPADNSNVLSPALFSTELCMLTDASPKILQKMRYEIDSTENLCSFEKYPIPP